MKSDRNLIQAYSLR